MIFQGSKWVHIDCVECEAISPKFRVYLYIEDGGIVWDGKEPEGWHCDEESGFYENEDWIIGYCPIHKEE